ncbi:MAG: hypothetical protein GF329_10765 [Candidatus Lokiarchaeota archaeon]|nr:hypothetical protein [Candidatus Lokiarchaeota archaeon]
MQKKNFWLFGGTGYPESGNSGLLNDLWRFNLTSNEWTWISGNKTRNINGVYGKKGTPNESNCPGSRYSSGTWIGIYGNLWLFGGYGYQETGTGIACLNDLWRFSSPIAPRYFELETTTTLPSLDGKFWLNWNESIGTENYSLYGSTSPGVDENDTIYVDGLKNASIFMRDFDSGIYYFRIAAYNNSGTTWSNELIISVQITDTKKNIPYGNLYLIIIILGIISLILSGRKKISNYL